MNYRALGRFAAGVAPGLLAVLLAAVVGTATLAADSQYISQKGTWITNKAETKIPPGGFTPLDTPVVVTQDDGTALNFVAYVMTGTGLQPGIAFEGAYDGKPYPYGKDTTRSFLHVSPSSFRTDVKAADGSSSTEVVTFAAGNAKLRAEGKFTDAAGKTYDYIQVWDKLQ